MPNPTQPMNEEELLDKIADLVEDRDQPGIVDLILADRDAAVREARIEELDLTLDGILGDSWTHSNPGSEEEFFRIHVEHVVHYLNARRGELQSQPNAKEAFGMKIEVSDKVPEDGIRFDHPDGRSEGFILGNAKEEE